MSRTMECAEVQLAIPWVLDDDVESYYLLDLEAHFEGCAHCRCRLEREVELRDQLRLTMDTVSASTRLRQRVRSTIEAERRSSHMLWRAWPAAAAAAVLMIFVWQGARGGDATAEFEEVAMRHARLLPMEVVGRDVNSLARYFHGKVPFALRLPKGTQPVQVAGRLTHLKDREAVHLRYDLADGGFSLFVYESTHNGPPQELTPSGVEIRQIHGFNVARWRDSGIVYSVVSEMPAKKLALLIDLVTR